MSRLQKLWEWELKQYKAYEDRYEYKAPNDIEFDTNKKTTHSQELHNFLDIDIEETRIEESTVDNIEIFENDDKKLFESIKDPNASLDPEFIQYTLPEFEKQGFTNCLIVVDEAHNFFGGALKPSFKRLLSYHRHYHDQDYLLISQDHKMFNFAVCQLTAYSIRAINPIMRWRSDVFTYNIYSGGYISFSGDNKLETKSLKAKDVIFNLYNSGGKVLQKSHFLKIVLKLLGGVFLLFLFGIYAFSDFTNQEVVVIEDKNTTKKAAAKNTFIKNTHDEKMQVQVFLLIGNKIIHKETGRKFIYKSFENLLNDLDQPISYDENMDGTVTIYYELTKQSLYNLGIRKKQNEINNFSSTFK